MNPKKVTLLLVSSLTIMAGATIAPTLPAMRAYFAGEPNSDFLVRLVLTLPALFIVIGSPAAGFIVDKFGRKKLLLFSLTLYATSGTSGFLLESLTGILISRAFLGLAVAGISVSSVTLIADYYENSERGSMLGLSAAFTSFGGVLFLVGGGFLAEINWRIPFLIYLAAALYLPLALLALSEPERVLPKQSEKVDTAPATNNFCGLIFLYAAAFVSMVVFYLVPVQLPFYLNSLSGDAGSLSGIAIGVSSLVSAVVATFYQSIRARRSFTQILSFGFLLAGLGYVIVGFAQTYPVVLIGLAITGAGNGLLMPNLYLWLTSIIPESTRGRAVSGLSMAIYIGQFISPFWGQFLIPNIGIGYAYAVSGGIIFLLGLAMVLLAGKFAPLQAEKYSPSVNI